MDYAAIKAVHLAAVVVSGSLFLVRGIWMLRDSPCLWQRWVRIVPHVNDTFLLAAGAWMSVLSGQAPGRNAWLTAKIVAVALRRDPLLGL